jgi:hypothetical protein
MPLVVIQHDAMNDLDSLVLTTVHRKVVTGSEVG